MLLEKLRMEKHDRNEEKRIKEEGSDEDEAEAR